MTQIKLRRDTSTNFTTKNPVLGEGEPAYETDTKKMKIGDGTTAYTQLDYFSTGGGSATFNVVQPLKLVDGTLTLQIDEQTIQVQNGKLVANLDELGNEVNTLAGELAGVQADLLGKEDKFEPKAPLIMMNKGSILLPTEEYTSNTVAGKYTITTAGQRYGVEEAYKRFKEEIWDGSIITADGESASLTYQRQDSKQFQAGAISINTPFITHRYCLKAINFYTLGSEGQTLETFTQSYESIPKATAHTYAMVVNPTLNYDGFKLEWVASGANGFDIHNQNRIGPITMARTISNLSLSIGNGLKINTESALGLQYPIQTMTKEDYNTITPEQDVIYMLEGGTSGGGGASIPIGQPQITLNNTLEDNEIWLEGAEVSRTTYAKLFSIYGTTYGSGDGSTTFNLPDFRNKAIWGSDQFGYIDAGLPNIGAGHSGIFVGYGTNSFSGAFSASSSTNTHPIGGNGGTDVVLNFDASKSNSIYGASDTVQPPSIKVRVKTRYK